MAVKPFTQSKKPIFVFISASSFKQGKGKKAQLVSAGAFKIFFEGEQITRAKTYKAGASTNDSANYAIGNAARLMLANTLIPAEEIKQRNIHFFCSEMPADLPPSSIELKKSGIKAQGSTQYALLALENLNSFDIVKAKNNSPENIIIKSLESFGVAGEALEKYTRESLTKTIIRNIGSDKDKDAKLTPEQRKVKEEKAAAKARKAEKKRLQREEREKQLAAAGLKAQDKKPPKNGRAKKVKRQQPQNKRPPLEITFDFSEESFAEYDAFDLLEVITEELDSQKNKRIHIKVNTYNEALFVMLQNPESIAATKKTLATESDADNIRKKKRLLRMAEYLLRKRNLSFDSVFIKQAPAQEEKPELYDETKPPQHRHEMFVSFDTASRKGKLIIGAWQNWIKLNGRGKIGSRSSMVSHTHTKALTHTPTGKSGGNPVGQKISAFRKLLKDIPAGDRIALHTDDADIIKLDKFLECEEETIFVDRAEKGKPNLNAQQKKALTQWKKLREQFRLYIIDDVDEHAERMEQIKWTMQNHFHSASKKDFGNKGYVNNPDLAQG